MLLFNEEALTSSKVSQFKLDSIIPFVANGTVDGQLTENRMDATAAGSDADGKGLLAFHMIPQPEHSVANLDKFLAQASKISPELDNESLRNSLAGLAQDISCLSSLNALQSSSTFLQELGLNSEQHKVKREWRNIGTFSSEEVMNEVRKRERVAKRKTVVQINGTKVFYRCNNWRRTNCNFRMHAIIHAPDKITLYASGEHDHTVKNPNSSSLMYDIPPCSSQQQILNQFIANATANSSHLLESNDQENTYEEEATYQLSDGQRIAALLQVAAELGHSFKFNSRSTGEYCIESNKPVAKGKMLVFVDHGTFVSVTERIGGFDAKCETWKKADWQQFLYAVRGKCRAVLY
ncbi:unnamed protein product [Enterobius vermicularis]|uniref:FLYWCH-type domain-containing protein n=1 Tax=Enterobius vermicularis TaxID=51028 RepID=A0A0N4UUI6_ENTVE|nr:unnamed protein product [Enterobius vermicularis]